MFQKKRKAVCNLDKRVEFIGKVKELFLGESSRNADYGPVRSDIHELLSEYNAYLNKYEQTEAKDKLLFLVDYLMHCRHCARPIDWELVEKLTNFLLI